MRLGLGLNITANSRRGGAPAFSPSTLYSSGSQGVWLDPSDLSTMFSDRAGTTPVTAPGTVVGLRLDKSKGLVLGAELVTNGDFSSGTTGWTVGSGVTISGGVANFNVTSFAGLVSSGSLAAGLAYKVSITVSNFTSGQLLIFGSGGASAARFIPPASNGTHVGYITAAGAGSIQIIGNGSFVGTLDNISVRELPGNHALAPTDAARPVYGIEPKGGRRNLLLATDTLATQSLTVTAAAHTLAFTGTGTVTLSGASTAGPLVGTGAGNRVSLTFTPTAASLTLTVSGSVTLGQLELGSSATAYQKVVTAENVTEAGVATCHYCRYDGANNSMSTSAIDFTATDKMSVFAGVRKLSDAAFPPIVELSSSATSVNGSFTLLVNGNTGAKLLAAGIRGTSLYEEIASSADYGSPISLILAGAFNISAASVADAISIRANGSPVSTSVLGGSSTGTGNFGNHPLFFGRRGNASLPFNGRDYGIIVVGKAASAGEITDTETWLAAKTSGVTL